MNDIVYRLRESESGSIEPILTFVEELGNDAVFYTSSGECHQKIVVSKHKVFYIILHSTLFSGNDRLENLTKRQLKLFYNISKNKLK
jgi:hypothetical protein